MHASRFVRHRTPGGASADPRLSRWSAIVPVCAAILFPGTAAWAEPDYAKDIKPLLKSRCYACHGALKQKSGLRLDTVALMRKGGESGNVVDPAAALLLERVSAKDEDERMPPEGAALSAEEIAKLKAWIAAGAPGPADEKPEEDPRKHWAYQTPKAAPLAAGRESPIDALLSARLRERGLTPQPAAAPEVWLRRVYLDLTGLPPTADEVSTFITDISAEPHADSSAPPVIMQRTVDRLLASPAYGERWGRHFMDIWRYSDWYGLGEQLRHSQKHIWHWRDWIVESLNADKGYDRMITDMLAADEATPEDRDALRATGFLARNYYLFNRTTWLDEVVEHTSRAFLGVTMQCVKCHDHKYDPVSHTDYYRMRAIFEPYHVRLDPWPGETDFEKDGLPRVFDLHLDKPTYLHRKGDEKNEDKSRAMQPGVPEVIAFAEFSPKPVTLPAIASAPVLLPFVIDDQLRAADGEIAQAKSALEQARRKRDEVKNEAEVEQAEGSVAVAEEMLVVAQMKPALLQAVLAAERAKLAKPAPGNLAALTAAAAKAEADFEFARAEAGLAKARHTPSAAAAKGKPVDAEKQVKAAETALAAAKKKAEKPGDKYTPIRASLKAQEGPEDKANADFQRYPDTSTGRRLALAQWIANERNPLTARVLVNHLWLRHFGAPLVADVTDFGRRSPVPLHQDVLDTLAVEFMQHGWSLKHLHRTMVLSQLYRRSSSNAGAAPATLAADPDNSCYWRMNPRRLESQAVRDSLLHAAGRLDLRVGGPGVDPGKEESSLRRALYFTQTADVEHRFLAAFDNANVIECYRRQESIVPQQALALANSKLTRECADAIVKRSEPLADFAFIEHAFMSLLSRAPTADERIACAESLAEFSKLNAANARTLVIQALMNHNDLVTLR